MNATRYMLVQMVEGRMIAQKFDDMAALEIRFGAPVAYATRRGLRDELQGQPQFRGLVGPMWGGNDTDGAAIVRYEDGQTNDRMSA
jgi:hypothetical protein